MSCPICQGKKTVKCPKCDGKGVLPQRLFGGGEKCPLCKGAGKVKCSCA